MNKNTETTVSEEINSLIPQPVKVLGGEAVHVATGLARTAGILTTAVELGSIGVVKKVTQVMNITQDDIASVHATQAMLSVSRY